MKLASTILLVAASAAAAHAQSKSVEFELMTCRS